MSTAKVGIGLLLLFAFLAISVVPVRGQATKKKGAPKANPAAQEGEGKVELEATQGTGKITEITQEGLIRVIGPGGGNWLIRVDPKAREVQYLAKAELSWLQPGAYVRFSTHLDKKGKAIDPVSTATVLSPRPEFPPGVVVEVTAGGLDTGGLFSDAPESPPKKKEAKKKKAEPINDDLSYLVTGRIAQIRDGKFTIQADSYTISGQFAATAKIAVELNELQGKVGDTVEFKGRKYPNSPNTLASEIKVTAAEPLKADESKRKGKSKGRDTAPGSDP
ncbi:MAG: hypothetical protein FJ295_14630 [Planctomycetes bacterium]|nr:hypothetical protein [Planctomycetota bacterium]